MDNQEQESGEVEGSLVGEKQCTKCERVLSCLLFSKCSEAKDGLNWRCKECISALNKGRSGREDVKATRRAYYQKNRPQILKRRREIGYWRSGNFKQYLRRRHLKLKFGMTPEDYDHLLASQGGVCVICARPPKANRKHPIDHCHKTGVIRGIVCDPCNRGLEAFSDSPETMRRAAEYVEKDRPEAKRVA